MSDMKPVGWVIVTPRGKAMTYTTARLKGPNARLDSARGAFEDVYDDARISVFLGDDVVTQARRLGYRAERVYVKGGN